MRPVRLLATLSTVLAVVAVCAFFLWPGSGPQRGRADPDANADGAVAPPAATVSPGDARADARGAPDAVAGAPLRHETVAGTPMSLPAIEGRFLRQGQVQLDALRNSLTSDRFDRDFEALDSAMRGSADAMALHDAYRDAIAQQRARAGLADTPQRLACGRDVCLGSVVAAQGDAGYSTWWNDFTSSSATPQGTAIDFPRRLADGRIEHRFFFSMDPAANRAILTNPR